MCLGLLPALAGCSSWFGDALQDPEVRLVKIDVVKAKLLEQHFLLRFRIDNPNAVSLPVRGLSYDVLLNDIPFTEGESSEWFTVPAHGSQTFTVPVTTNLWRHVKSIVRMLDDPNAPIRYRLRGEVKLGMMFGQHVQVSRVGEIIPGDYLPE
jgi:LEA14-like dessication related protein